MHMCSVCERVHVSYPSGAQPQVNPVHVSCCMHVHQGGTIQNTCIIRIIQKYCIIHNTKNPVYYRIRIYYYVLVLYFYNTSSKLLKVRALLDVSVTVWGTVRGFQSHLASSDAGRLYGPCQLLKSSILAVLVSQKHNCNPRIHANLGDKTGWLATLTCSHAWQMWR